MRLSPRGGPGRWLGALALAVALAVAGCGGAGGKGTVSGKVTYKGAPLKAGRVAFATSTKQNVVAEIGEDGSYTAPDVATGPAKISVQTSYLKQASKVPHYKVPEGAPPGLGGGDPSLAKRYTAIPDNYEDPEKSGLTYDVKRGSQTHDIDLK
jgi:hypothetical protein